MLRDLFYTIKQGDGPSVELPGLMLAMWQMEQLQERHLPRIHAHFNGLDMKMDTSLWFLVSKGSTGSSGSKACGGQDTRHV